MCFPGHLLLYSRSKTWSCWSCSNEELGYRLIRKYTKMLFKTSNLAFQWWPSVIVSYSYVWFFNWWFCVLWFFFIIIIFLNLVAHPSGQTKAYHSRLATSYLRWSCQDIEFLCFECNYKNLLVQQVLFCQAPKHNLLKKCGFMFGTEVWKLDNLDSICSSAKALFHAFSQISWDLNLRGALRVQTASPLLWSMSYFKISLKAATFAKLEFWTTTSCYYFRNPLLSKQ